MTVVEGERTAERLSTSARSCSCGAGDGVRVLDDVGHVPAAEVEASVSQVVAAIDDLAWTDPTMLDADGVTALAQGLERLRRQVDAAAASVAGHVAERRPFADQGFLSAKAWSKHRLQLSNVEAIRRLRVARLRDRVPLWADAERSGLIGVAQTELLANVAANPAIDEAALHRDRFELLSDAIDLPFAEFEARLRRWEALADPAGAADAAERNRRRRDAIVLPRDDGGFDVRARLDGVCGAEFTEIFSHFVDAEWAADWAEARNRLGAAATTADLARNESQRRADAMLTMARAAASRDADPTRACPTVNLLIDGDTTEATATGRAIEPARYRDVVCRSQDGHELHPVDVVNSALWAHIRRVVTDASGVVIDLGRRRRLFEGSARDAVMLLAPTCVWVGCDRPASWCQADHSVGWRQHGATVPDNGSPLCGAHNRLKERGFQVYRDHDGEWHTIDPRGDEIL